MCHVRHTCVKLNNQKIFRLGYCGYQDLRNIERKEHRCSVEDALCGLLHCQFEANSTREVSELAINSMYVNGKGIGCMYKSLFNKS